MNWIVVTPDMYRVQHSIKLAETNRNFGFNLPWWDRLLGTYRDQPGDGHDAMAIGSILVPTPDGATVPIAQLAVLEEVVGPRQITRENGMVLVTSLNHLVENHIPVGEASMRGALLRLRPVLLTAMTTTLELVPLLLSSGTGSEVQRPLATVVIGGLATSTVLTLLVLPAIYRWFAPAPNGGSGR